MLTHTFNKMYEDYLLEMISKQQAIAHPHIVIDGYSMHGGL